MPVFFDPLLVFVHIPKNAGRSVEDAFLPAHDNSDWGRPGKINRAARLLLDVSSSQFASRHLIGTQDIAIAAQHLTYAEMELLGLLPNAQPQAVFCVCRNPYDRAVSSVTHFLGAQDTAADFEKALFNWLDQPISDHNQRAHRRTQLSYILTSRGKPAITDLLRFERLDKDFAAFAAKIGRDGRGLPWRGKAGRSRDLEGIYTPNAKSLIEREFGEDLEHFKYSFP